MESIEVRIKFDPGLDKVMRSLFGKMSAITFIIVDEYGDEYNVKGMLTNGWTWESFIGAVHSSAKKCDGKPVSVLVTSIAPMELN